VKSNKDLLYSVFCDHTIVAGQCKINDEGGFFMNVDENGGNYAELSNCLLTKVESLGFKPNTIRSYRRILGKIATFMNEAGITDYSREIGIRYISGCMEKNIDYASPLHPAETVVRRLDDLLAGGICLHRRSIEAPQCPPIFTEQLDRYIDRMRFRGKMESTIKNRKRYCVQFLRYLEKAGVTTLSDIHSKDVHGAFLDSNSKGSFRQSVVPFLKYLHKEGIHGNDLSECVPGVRKPQPMPSVYSEDEIATVLSCIDQSAPNGKRDYAIIIIASHLGFRASDISALTMGNFDFKTKTVHLTQQKTGALLQVVLLAEVEEALLRYVELARPTSNSEQIFLRRRAPHIPLNPGAIYEIVRSRLNEAGIDSSGKKRGPHSLRMSLATKLLSDNVPYAAIQKILGHESPESTKHYAKMDTAMLRRCALEVPPPTGLFAERLCIKGV
jgi:site-specific recombinase XerD